jgi:hypothetical protein
MVCPHTPQKMTGSNISPPSIPIAPYSIKLPIHPYPHGGSLMKSLAGVLVEVMPSPLGDRGPPQKAAMSLRPARAEEGLRLTGPGCACCLASQFPVSRAPAGQGVGVGEGIRLTVSLSGSLGSGTWSIDAQSATPRTTRSDRT